VVERVVDVDTAEAHSLPPQIRDPNPLAPSSQLDPILSSVSEKELAVWS